MNRVKESKKDAAISDAMKRLTLGQNKTYLEVNVWPLSVKTDSDSFQFSLEQFPLCDRLGGVQHDHDQIGSSGYSNNLVSEFSQKKRGVSWRVKRWVLVNLNR